MTGIVIIPETATSIRLFRIVNEKLIACEPVRFMRGHIGVELTLRRAKISGRVEVGGQIENHFADILDHNGSMVETVSLDRESYSALKNKWMRCALDKELNVAQWLTD